MTRRRGRDVRLAVVPVLVLGLECASMRLCVVRHDPSHESEGNRQRNSEKSKIGYKTATGDSLEERKGERRIYQAGTERSVPATERS
ncbi:hypothetical protein B0H14DRAFT_2849470 [Mycena olivaceomarginata]|nr:hypothetical protein B0H14DRAFT_2849470 [Mycena olivaceomarginata]